MIRGLAHVCLSTTDLDAAERFYCTGLGLKKVFNFVRAGQVDGFYLEVSEGAYIEVFLQDDIGDVGRSPIRHFCLEVDDMDQIGARLRELGYEASDKKLGADGSWQMWTTDPSGVYFEFHQYTDKSCQKTREDCVLD